MALKLILALLLCSLWSEALVFTTLADTTITGSVQAVSAAPISAIFVQFVCSAGNAATIRIGSQTQTPTSTNGVPCAPGGVQFLPAIPNGAGSYNRYDLSTLYLLGTANDTVSISYGQ